MANFRITDYTGVGPDFVQMRPRAGYDLVRYMPEALLVGDRAVVLHEYGGPEKLKFEDNVPDSHINGGMVLIACDVGCRRGLGWPRRYRSMKHSASAMPE